MIRNLKVLLLAMTAMLALSAVGAAASQAALFHSEATETTLTVKTDGANNTKQSHQVFDAAGATVTCGGVAGDSLIKEQTPTTVTAKVTYDTPCTFVGQSATINMGACDYAITAHGTVSIVGAGCEASPITVTVPSPPCTVTISNAAGANQNLESITFKNLGAGTTREVTIEPHVTGISYSATGSGCPLTGARTDGNYTTGNALVSGDKPGTATQVGTWWE
jgi:hypothetical protein